MLSASSDGANGQGNPVNLTNDGSEVQERFTSATQL